jgi:hypothetical protein
VIFSTLTHATEWSVKASAGGTYPSDPRSIRADPTDSGHEFRWFEEFASADRGVLDRR